MPTFGFVGATYQTSDRRFSAEECINLFPEEDQSGRARNKMHLLGTPGLSELCALPTSPVRALWSGDNKIYAVGGSNLYEISTGGVVYNIGALNSAATPASIHSNGNSLFVVSGDECFLHDGTNITKVLSDGFVSGCFLGGYYVALQNPTATNGLTRDKIHISALYDGSTWDPLDTQDKMGKPDRLVAIASAYDKLWLFGQKTISVWWHSGRADFPFEPVQGSELEIGAYPWTICKTDYGLMFMGSTDRGGNQVWLMDGYTPRRVSHYAVEQAFNGMPANAVPSAYAYQESGHHFYVLCLPTETWAYDLSTGMWHRRAVWDSVNKKWLPHPCVCAAHLYLHMHILGSGEDGRIYLQSDQLYTIRQKVGPNYIDYPIRRYRQSPYVADENRVIFHHKFTLDLEIPEVETGDIAVWMKYSDDGGRTFCDEKQAPDVEAGDYTRRVVWRRLGRSRHRLYGVTLEASVPVAIVDAYVDVSSGNRQ